MSVKECSYGNLTAAEFLSDLLERRSLLSLRGEESLGRLGELRMLRDLLLLLVILKLTKLWAVSTYIKGGKVRVRHRDSSLHKRALEERGDDFSRDCCILC